MIRVVVIDSGIYPEHNAFKNIKLHMLEYRHGNVEPGGYDSCGHGTAVAGIIAKNDDVSITSIKIQDIEYKANEDDLIAVLQYINSTLAADIINISLGVNILERKKELYQICEDISKTGTVIVSAFDITNIYAIFKREKIKNFILQKTNPRQFNDKWQLNASPPPKDPSLSDLDLLFVPLIFYPHSTERISATDILFSLRDCMLPFFSASIIIDTPLILFSGKP